MAISIYTSSHLYIPTKSGDVCDKEWTHLTMIGHVTKTGHLSDNDWTCHKEWTSDNDWTCNQNWRETYERLLERHRP